MRTGTKTLPEIDFKSWEKAAPGINWEAGKQLWSWIGSQMSERKTPLYIFIQPQLKELSDIVKAPPADVWKFFHFVSSRLTDKIQMKVILQDDDENFVYELQQEDMEEVEEKNELTHPYDPRRKYPLASRLLRHAFVVLPANEDK